MIRGLIEISESNKNSLDIIKQANSRNIGNICFREVIMTLGKLDKSITNPNRQFTIRTLRYIKDNKSQGVFCLFSPRWFRGISFLMEEYQNNFKILKLFLHLPYGLHLIKNVNNLRRCEGLIGSDFSYDDLKIWLYEDGQTFSIIGHDIYEGFNCIIVECIPIDEDFLKFANWTKQQIWIDEKSFVIRQIKYFSSNSKEPYRCLSIYGYHEIDGILIPNKMLMTNYKKNHETTIRLNRAWYNKPIDLKIFEKDSLKKCKDYLKNL